MLETIIKLVSSETSIPAERINEDSEVQDLLLDSIDEMEVTMAIEETFDIDIENEEFEKIETIRDIVSLVESKTKNKY